ncbi:hypothetical protein EDF77_3013 [Stenotrophomonas maltophilia]|uniref:hypothetical protein n=1 Tax=Stenotrophomonas chelatiphaga TaxID=517011 RepID=UPI000F4B1016|nr:hypothetical protein [Stenotrophomonas chelatiphaga]MCS4231216.1 hypothetical protein [Stenotrophomonas chelatiphaga]ROQ39190.1 hypothetical protein EDF77_3013 [Stenotrophomonas maltophilia]
MIGTLYSAPNFVTRTAASLPRPCPGNPSGWLLGRIGNIATLPRQPQRIENYRAATQAWIPRAVSPFAGTPQASTTGQRRLCSFTGLLLGNSGRFNPADVAAHLGKTSHRVLCVTTPVMVVSAAAKSVGTADRPASPVTASQPPRIAPPALGDAANAAPTTAAAASPPTPAQSPRVEPSISDDSVLSQIAAIRKQWQDGMFARPTGALQPRGFSAEQIQAEIKAARNVTL